MCCNKLYYFLNIYYSFNHSLKACNLFISRDIFSCRPDHPLQPLSLQDGCLHLAGQAVLAKYHQFSGYLNVLLLSCLESMTKERNYKWPDSVHPIIRGREDSRIRGSENQMLHTLHWYDAVSSKKGITPQCRHWAHTD